MIGFITGNIIIIGLCITALIIHSKKDRTIIDNFASEYKKMFDQGLVPRRKRTYN